jgi:hypothetical protein
MVTICVRGHGPLEPNASYLKPADAIIDAQLARHHGRQQMKVLLCRVALVARQDAASHHDRRDALLEHVAQRADRLDTGWLTRADSRR